jgi:hypothetical protein
MKTKYILILALLFSTTLFAQKVVALHSPTNGIQYFDDDNPLQSAYTAAIDNDTIYLPGGSMAPPSKFEKKLIIYGAGHYPDATSATFKTVISGNFNLSDEADGFHLEGVFISGNLNFDSGESINDVVIKRCKFSTLYVSGDRTNPAENNTFIENVITGSLNIDNLINSSFFNNIIQGGIVNARSLIFLNNLFLYNGAYSDSQVIYYANNSMFKNNIFLQQNNDICEGAGASTWSHNIFCTSTTSPQLGLDPILIDNYFMDRADVLVNQTGNSFDYSHDYHLQSGAAANLGDDGYETGIYGGYYPWKDYSIPVNPHISSKSISGTSDTNGMIQVDINVHAQNR